LRSAVDVLIDRIEQKANPTCAGLDTLLSFLPEGEAAKCRSLEDAAKAIFEFNARVIDALADVVPAVKIQLACYEMYGVAGMQCFRDTADYAREKGLTVIADGKRNDIGSTAGYYSSAYLGGTEVGGQLFEAFPCDFLTVNAYLGSDGLKPFISDCVRRGKGIFALAKTSNPSSAELQDREFLGGVALYSAAAELVESCGKGTEGEYGYGCAGIVAGATHPGQAAALRARHKSLFFLIPGYGAQGGSAEDAARCFDESGRGGIVNSSRGLLLAYRDKRYAGMTFAAAARAAAQAMAEDLCRAIGRKNA